MNIAQLGLSSREFCKSARKKEDPGKGRRSRLAFQGCQYMQSGSGGYSELPWLQTAASSLEQLERGKERDPIQSHHSPPDLCCSQCFPLLCLHAASSWTFHRLS